ncbi:MAG: hypothetical protein KJO69_01995 [Gammaproteobacteria bacterium]|nr:hypothetical protein [Gammaproteobacteria bacterium]NNJ72861.1 hypothetical protein [Enterobacterales bacterium]
MELNDQSRLHRFLAKSLIRWKFIKRSPLELDLVNQEIRDLLPSSFMINIPSGAGELTLDDAVLSIDDDIIVAEALCHFKVTVANNNIYNAYIRLTLDGKIVYDLDSKVISPSNVRVVSTKLISDKRSMIKDTRTLIIDLLPEPIKTVFISSFVMSDSILKTIGVSELLKYLSLYLSGSKQRVLDYHHQEIENLILGYLNSDVFNHQLDSTDFQQQLFAEYGQEITIQDGQIFFVFHPEN